MLENCSKNKAVSNLISGINNENLIIGEKALSNEYIAIYKNPKKELEVFKLDITYKKGKYLKLVLPSTDTFEQETYRLNKLADVASIIASETEISVYDNSFIYYKDADDSIVLHMNIGKRKKA